MRLSVFLIAVLLLLTSCSAGSTSRVAPGVSSGPDTQSAAAESKAVAAELESRAWLGMTDGGRYDESWGRAASMFRAAVTEEQWRSAMDSVRAPLGPVITRTLKAADYSRAIPGAPDGDYVTVTYATAFGQKEAAVETVVMTIDRGKWRVAGYFIR